tara:strand:- start:2244 stop:3083 length:840 start_codon:yes stop_codon:yes gene_type:complete
MATIPYIKGFSVKPERTTETGTVIFTDGTNEITPNQLQCEAYGYTYDKASGTCSTFTYSTALGRAFSNLSNFIKGVGNTTQTGTNNTLVMGESNTVGGMSRNNLIIGSNNEISNGVNNATVVGNYGLAERDGEFVVGGGGFSGAGKGYAQCSTITLTGTTTDGVATDLFINGDSSQTIIIRGKTTGSFQGFEAHLLAVRTGGSSGSGAVDDRLFQRVSGLIYLTARDATKTELGSFGTVTGWEGEPRFTGTNDMLFSVTGAADMNISWSCTLNIYEINV